MNNIGLERHTVRLLPHQTIWKEIYELTKENIFSFADSYILDIQHIGSTSIKGIKAKPIIDIAILVKDNNVVQDLIPLFELHQYLYRGDGGNEGGHLFIQENAPNIRTHHIHVILENDIQWSNYLLFRDTLNQSSELAKQYSELKTKLALLYPIDRISYTNSRRNLFLEY